MPDLATELAALDPGTRQVLDRGGFSDERLLDWAGRLLHAGPDANRVRGAVEPPAPGDVVPLPERNSDAGRRLIALGMEAMSRGELALVVLAGGMATRMGGVVKALVDAVPGVTFLDARLAEREHWEARAGAPLPMLLMTSHATAGPIEEALAGRDAGGRVSTFTQGASLRLTPEGSLFREDDGRPSIHATGHGDLPDAMARSGAAARLREAGVKVLWLANLDNLGAAVDPLVLGWHLERGAPLTVEVVEKWAGDHGGIPARVDGRPVVLESFRLPAGFDEDAVRVFNTNTFLVDAAAVDGIDPDWTWFRVDKTVDGRPAVQFERLVGELTSWLDSAYLLVPRSGPESRFIPAKDHAELERNRGAIEGRLASLRAGS